MWPWVLIVLIAVALVLTALFAVCLLRQPAWDKNGEWDIAPEWQPRAADAVERADSVLEPCNSRTTTNGAPSRGSYGRR
jgi:hypothetical protein